MSEAANVYVAIWRSKENGHIDTFVSELYEDVVETIVNSVAENMEEDEYYTEYQIRERLEEDRKFENKWNEWYISMPCSCL